jgi:hypothetical protein
MIMSKSKKVAAPKFEPVEIADYRPGAFSLGLSREECDKIISEDMSRIIPQQALATLQRLTVLRNHLGVAPGDNIALMVAIANAYVPGFEIKVGKVARPGPAKKGERFKIVTTIEALAAAEQIDISVAIRKAAQRKIGGRMLSAESLSTKYYGALREIEDSFAGGALLRFWRRRLPDDISAEMDPLFWSFENQELNAVRPHNVHEFPSRK